MSITIAVGGARSRDSSSGGWPVMPSEVALITAETPSRAWAASSHPSAETRPSRAAIASARSRERLTRRTWDTPASSRFSTAARAAPPAPSTTTGLRVRRPPAPLSAARRPTPSVLSARTLPSAWKTKRLAAPARLAATLCWSARAKARSLKGMVTLSPSATWPRNPFTSASKPSSWGANAR